ncbi:MAG: hypothetical protein AAF465_09480 [Pseudomonadota bacterium]
MNKIFHIVIIVATASLSCSASWASDQPPRWYDWRFRIDNSKCLLTQNYQLGTAGDDAAKGFLLGTDYTNVMIHIFAQTHSRDADRYRIGEAIFGIKIWSQVKKEPQDQLAVMRLDGKEKKAEEVAKWASSTEPLQAFSGFWFYGSDADELIYRFTQNEPIPMVFITSSGERLIETTYRPNKRHRFRAWAEAFRACAIANQE